MEEQRSQPKREVGEIKIGFCFEGVFDSYQNGGNLGCLVVWGEGRRRE